MIRKFAISAFAALTVTAGAALAAGSEGHVHDVDFSFEGPFGSYDQNQLQRGLQVYTEVCSACHGLRYVPIRTLHDEGGPGLPEDQVRAYAAQNFEVFDADLDDFRPATPNDQFPGSNLENAPDLSLMAKARAGFHGPYGTGINQLFKGMGGPEYIVSLLTGYTGETREQAGTTFYENTAFPGGWIAMAPPLSDEQVEYADGHSNDLHHMAEDVAAFLMWAAEPKMMARKHAGFTSVIFLAILASLLYLTNKKLWAPHKGKRDPEAAKE
ncbi:MAG: cytochrome c1 [Pseudooceanicola sp.]